MALDTILIQREFQTEEDERRRAERVADIIRKALRGELLAQGGGAPAPIARGPASRPSTVEPRVIIDNQSSNRYTVIEINGLDRLGLLYDLTEALYRLNLNIASAHVTTFGEKAIDVFYVTDLTGAKIENEPRRKQIENALTQVLAGPADGGMKGGCLTCRCSNPRQRVGGFTLISRLLGFLRDQFIAFTLGTGPVAEAFFVAQRFPNLFRALFAEGAFNTAFVPLFAKQDRRRRRGQGTRFRHRGLLRAAHLADAVLGRRDDRHAADHAGDRARLLR